MAYQSRRRVLGRRALLRSVLLVDFGKDVQRCVVASGGAHALRRRELVQHSMYRDVLLDGSRQRCGWLRRFSPRKELRLSSVSV